MRASQSGSARGARSRLDGPVPARAGPSTPDGQEAGLHGSLRFRFSARLPRKPRPPRASVYSSRSELLLRTATERNNRRFRRSLASNVTNPTAQPALRAMARHHLVSARIQRGKRATGVYLRLFAGLATAGTRAARRRGWMACQPCGGQLALFILREGPPQPGGSASSVLAAHAPRAPRTRIHAAGVRLSHTRPPTALKRPRAVLSRAGSAHSCATGVACCADASSATAPCAASLQILSPAALLVRGLLDRGAAACPQALSIVAQAAACYALQPVAVCTAQPHIYVCQTCTARRLRSSAPETPDLGARLDRRRRSKPACVFLQRPHRGHGQYIHNRRQGLRTACLGRAVQGGGPLCEPLLPA